MKSPCKRSLCHIFGNLEIVTFCAATCHPTGWWGVGGGGGGGGGRKETGQKNRQGYHCSTHCQQIQQKKGKFPLLINNVKYLQ